MLPLELENLTEDLDSSTLKVSKTLFFPPPGDGGRVQLSLTVVNVNMVLGSGGQIEICAGSLRCLRNLRNLVSAQADSKFAQVCVSLRYGYNNTTIYICIESCTTYSNF